jgi:hypothetical protein
VRHVLPAIRLALKDIAGFTNPTRAAAAAALIGPVVGVVAGVNEGVVLAYVLAAGSVATILQKLPRAKAKADPPKMAANL